MAIYTKGIRDRDIGTGAAGGARCHRMNKEWREACEEEEEPWQEMKGKQLLLHRSSERNGRLPHLFINIRFSGNQWETKNSSH